MSMINWKEEAAGIAEELKEIRKTIHRHPEIGNREYKTSALVEEYLQELGIKTRRVLGTAIIGELAGSKDGPVVALRADMDALPIQEKTDVPFRSEILVEQLKDRGWYSTVEAPQMRLNGRRP